MEPIKLLDFGYVEFIEAMGTGKAGKGKVEQGMEFGTLVTTPPDYEVGIIEAARQSTHGSFKGWETDEKLLASLYTRHHDTPFEFAELIIEVQAPIMVFREWQRHRTQSYNEMSARYAPLPDLYYWVPPETVLARARKAVAESNRQAAGIAKVDEQRLVDWVAKDHELAILLEGHYREGLACGVPKELARKKMPVDHYSRMRAKANLRNWLAFMTLRCDPNAQWEIRQYAWTVATIIAEVFPRTSKLWDARRENGAVGA